MTQLIVPTCIFMNIDKIGCGWAHVIVVSKDGDISSFGRNNLDQLGRKDGE